MVLHLTYLYLTYLYLTYWTGSEEWGRGNQLWRFCTPHPFHHRAVLRSTENHHIALITFFNQIEHTPHSLLDIVPV